MSASTPYTNRSDRPSKIVALTNAADRVPPHSAEAEMAVLGAIMLDKRALNRVMEILDAESFYKEVHRKIFETMLAMSEESNTIDLVTLSEELRKRGILEELGGTYYISELNARTPTAANVEQYAHIVQEHYLKREMIRAASEILEQCYDPGSDALEEIDQAESKVFAIGEKRLRTTYSVMKKLAKETFEMIVSMTDREGNDSGIVGVPTGFTKMDDMLGGLQKSDLVILAARPSMGKTAFALSIARNVAVESKIPTAIFSIEMASAQLVIRLLSAEARVNAQSIRTGRIKDADMPKLARNIGILAESKIYIDDSAYLSVMELRAKCRRLKAEHNIGLIVIDYLQLLHVPKAESREREISMISRTLKQVAKELDVPVVALSQLNRSVESRADKRPMLSDLRESGSIEQDADVVMFIHRPEHYDIATFEDGMPTEGMSEIIIGKQRNGPVGSVRLAFLKDYARFENPEFRNDEPADFSAEVDYGEAPF